MLLGATTPTNSFPCEFQSDGSIGSMPNKDICQLLVKRGTGREYAQVLFLNRIRRVKCTSVLKNFYTTLKFIYFMHNGFHKCMCHGLAPWCAFGYSLRDVCQLRSHLTHPPPDSNPRWRAPGGLTDWVVGGRVSAVFAAQAVDIMAAPLQVWEG